MYYGTNKYCKCQHTILVHSLLWTLPCYATLYIHVRRCTSADVVVVGLVDNGWLALLDGMEYWMDLLFYLGVHFSEVPLERKMTKNGSLGGSLEVPPLVKNGVIDSSGIFRWNWN